MVRISRKEASVTHSRSMVRSPVSLILASLAFGCAEMVRGTHQNVPFSSSPPGAVVQSGSSSCETPCTLNLGRGEPHSVTLSKDGYQATHVQLNSELNGGWLIADIFTWFPFNFFFINADYDLVPATVDVVLEPLKTSELFPRLEPLVMEFRVTNSRDGHSSVAVRERPAN